MNDIVTTDLSNYGYRELVAAADLLKIYADNGADFLTDGISLNFNRNSGYVFLSDEDYNVGVIEDGKLVQFFSCGQCGYEGTQYDATEEGKDFLTHNGYCSKACEEKNQ